MDYLRILVSAIALLALQVPAPALAQAAGARKAEEEESKVPDSLVFDEEWQGPTLRFRGRIYGSFESIDPPGRAPGDSRLNDAYIRKADIRLRGSLWKDLGYYVKTEHRDGDVQLRDAYLGYNIGFAVIQAGYMDPVDELMIPAYHEFMERSAMEGFPPGNQLGIGLMREREHYTIYVAAFRDTIEDLHVKDAGTTYSTRFTYSPPVPEGSHLHLGGYASWSNADAAEAGLFRYSARSVLRTGERYVDTGAVASEEALLGIELAAGSGAFALESQCAVVRASVPAPGEPDSYLNGCYLSGMWTITGEPRNYRGGRFSRIKVARPVFEGGPGTWQISARYDTIDLSDGAIQGGGQNTWSFSLTWYLNRQFWVSADYSRTKLLDNDFRGEITSGLGARLYYLVTW